MFFLGSKNIRITMLKKDTEHSYSISVSYLEIYNETGYDLLDGDRDMKRLEDMP